VLVEGQHRAEAGFGEGVARAAEAVAVQPPEVDALLEIDVHAAEGGQRPRPVVPGVDVLGLDDDRLGRCLRHGSS
jgi:hypothetical protein